MKKFAIYLTLFIAFSAVGWWAVGLPHATDAVATAPPPSATSAAALSGSDANVAASGAPVWRSGLQSAIAEASEQKKDVLLLFSSNGPSAVEALQEKQLASETVRSGLSDRFILARFDCHPDTSAADDAAATRDTWAEKLEIKSFSSLVLLDARGRACAGIDLTSIDSTTLQSTIANLQQHRILRDRYFARADQQTGLDQAASLDAGLQTVKPYLQASYQQVMEQIVADDPDDKGHLRDLYFPLVTKSRIDVAVQHEVYPLIDRKLYQAAIDRLTQLMSEESPPAEQRQLLLAFQGQLFSNLGDDKSALHTLDLAIAADPTNTQVDQIRTCRDHIAQGKQN